jgi:hypothetical protein
MDALLAFLVDTRASICDISHYLKRTRSVYLCVLCAHDLAYNTRIVAMLPFKFLLRLLLVVNHHDVSECVAKSSGSLTQTSVAPHCDVQATGKLGLLLHTFTKGWCVTVCGVWGGPDSTAFKIQTSKFKHTVFDSSATHVTICSASTVACTIL